MNAYSLITIITSFAFVLLGNFIHFKNRASRFHRIYATGFYAAAAYLFCLFAYHRADDIDEAWFWLRLSSVVHFIPPIALHAVILLTGKLQQLHKLIKHAIIYVPFIVFFIIDVFYPEITYGSPIHTGKGWSTTFKTEAVLYYINMLGYAANIVTQFTLLMVFLIKSKDKIKKRFARFVLITFLMPIFFTFTFLFFFPFLSTTVLRVESFFTLLSCVLTAFSLYKYNIFDLSTDIITKDIISNMSNFLVLMNPDKEIIEMNGRANELFQYEKEELVGEKMNILFEKVDCEKIFNHKMFESNSNIEVSIKRKDNSYFPAMLSIASIIKKNEFLGYILIGSDFSNVYSIKEEKKVIELELRFLRSQMNPHFFFNSLNSIRYLVLAKDRKKTDSYIVKLAHILRYVLEKSDRSTTSIQEELNFIKQYLEIEAMRFDENFKYTINLNDQVESENVHMPPMILQPFVENAIWHGLLPKMKGSRLLEINVYTIGSSLMCKIEDNGVGRKQAAMFGDNFIQKSSMGIANIEDRIRILNKQSGSQSIKLNIVDKINKSGQASGTVVTLEFQQL